MIRPKSDEHNDDLLRKRKGKEKEKSLAISSKFKRKGKGSLNRVEGGQFPLKVDFPSTNSRGRRMSVFF